VAPRRTHWAAFSSLAQGSMAVAFISENKSVFQKK